MADALSADNAVSLLGNTIPTGAILVVLITILGPVSGAHFNPAVSVVFALRREPAVGAGHGVHRRPGRRRGAGQRPRPRDVRAADPRDRSKARSGTGQWLAEAVATFGLVATILGGLRFRAEAVPWLVGLYITAAYWFTASTSFANPAVALARCLTDTFAGIRPADVPAFVVAELAGAILALGFVGWLLAPADHGEPVAAE